MVTLEQKKNHPRHEKIRCQLAGNTTNLNEVGGAGAAQDRQQMKDRNGALRNNALDSRRNASALADQNSAASRIGAESNPPNKKPEFTWALEHCLLLY